MYIIYKGNRLKNEREGNWRRENIEASEERRRKGNVKNKYNIIIKHGDAYMAESLSDENHQKQRRNPSTLYPIPLVNGERAGWRVKMKIIAK